ncbi:hypothetical protein [Actinospica robiniae]|uniref:hypothetical protein n=1 Tax=Actinospica robiniae TaxID=304901 RepID=UPI0003FCD739|nr:hypothetical protein [Actinospica robiniae]
MPQQLKHWFDTAGPLPQAVAGLAALIAAIVLILVLIRSTRALRGKKAADSLTVVAAAMASSVAATGMWHFFSRTMHLPVWIQAVLFAFMEISVLASALRARANVARDGQAGADGIAVWVLTSASGLMSASEATSPQEALVRLGAPLVAAWLWERSMVPERRARRAAEGRAESVRWLLSYKRIAVRLGLATALGANLETEDANRRIDRFVRADNRAQRAGVLTRRHATRRRDRAHARLMEQARMQADPRALYTHLGRQAILDVLARLGGDDAVIDRERARQMRHILTDALDEAPSETEAEAESIPAQAQPARPAATRRHAAAAAAPATPASETAAAPAVPADELPLTLPALVSAAEQAIAAAPPAFHIPGARQAPPAPAAYTNGTNAANGAHAAHAANGRGYAAAPPPGYPAPAREQILAPVRFVAATLPDPEPVYADEPDPDPEPAPGPPRALDADLAARITQIMAESPIPPNTMKLANSLGLTAAELADVLDALGGYDAAYSRARQDREAELGDTDAAFYPA